MLTIERVEALGLLNSCGSAAVEITLRLSSGISVSASAPAALVPGRRERALFSGDPLNEKETEKISGVLTASLQGYAVGDQREFDERVKVLDSEHSVGSDVMLGLSLAHLRAVAAGTGGSLLGVMLSLTGAEPKIPTPLVNVFSGGVHDPSGMQPFQQIMLITRAESFGDSVRISKDIYDGVFSSMERRDEFRGLASSSGMLTHGLAYTDLFEMILNEIERKRYFGSVSLAVDVAAEHLLNGDGLYKFGNDYLDTAGASGLLTRLVEGARLEFIEDPFDPGDETAWRTLAAKVGDDAVIVGDDLFATNAENIREGMAGGMIIKMNQVGSLSDTFKAVKKADAIGMIKCVSHRSCETEDTAMVDLSVAIRSDYVKLGGPRRGDRIAKYNRYLRIERELADANAG